MEAVRTKATHHYFPQTQRQVVMRGGDGSFTELRPSCQGSLRGSRQRRVGGGAEKLRGGRDDEHREDGEKGGGWGGGRNGFGPSQGANGQTGAVRRTA